MISNELKYTPLLRELIGKLSNKNHYSIDITKREMTIISDALEGYISDSDDQMDQEDAVKMVMELEQICTEILNG